MLCYFYSTHILYSSSEEIYALYIKNAIILHKKFNKSAPALINISFEPNIS